MYSLYFEYFLGIYGRFRFWKSELHFSYPENKVFEASAVRLRDAENIAAAKALQWLIKKRIINKNRKLIQFSKEDERKIQEIHSAPYSICIPQELQDKMQEALSCIEVSFVLFMYLVRDRLNILLHL